MPYRWQRVLTLGACCLLSLGNILAQNAKPAAPAIVPLTKPSRGDLNDDALFGGMVPIVQLVISPENLNKLAREPRNLVECSLREKNGPTLENCLVKLKGSAGSFRQINDDRPGFSMRIAKVKEQDFHGITKFMFNNCAQDGTMLHEQMAGEMARVAGVPASRCTHAYLTLNNKVLGTYVLKEGFNGEFLQYFFDDTHGHIYDGGFCNEINPNLECDKGNPNEKTRLLELIAACQESQADRRLQRVNRIVDIDAYLRYVFLEEVLCHWDGYSFNRNNYRIYEEPTVGKFYFILHGMDQMFGDPRWYVFRQPGAMVPNAIWGNKDIRARFRRQAFDVYDQALRKYDWPNRAIQVAADLKEKIRPIDLEESKRFDQRGADAAREIRERLDNVRRQLEDAYQLSEPTGTKVLLNKYAWQPSNDKGDAQEKHHSKKDCFYLKVGADGGADFRLQLSLDPGHYQFGGLMETHGIKGGNAENAKGARFRISGEGANPKNLGLLGDTPWTPIVTDFVVTDADPTLIIEIRGSAGELWVDRNSLFLTRLP